MIELGQKVKDKVTGFTGIAVSKTLFINGCIRFSLQPVMDKKGVVPEEKWFDEKQLVVVGAGIKIKATNTGGPISIRVPFGARS